MPATKRATIYFDLTLHDALRERAIESETSISDIVNEAVRQTLADYAQDAEDITDLARRRTEPNIDFEEFLADMKSRGRL